MKPQEIIRFINKQCVLQELTQFDLVARTGYPRANLSRWFSGRRGMKLDQVSRVLGAMGYELEIRSLPDAKSKRLKAPPKAPRADRKPVRRPGKRKAP